MERVEESVLEPLINEERINKFLNHQHIIEDRKETKLVEAKLFVLEGDRGILLEVDKAYECFSMGEDSEVEKKEARYIQADEYIIVNNKSEPQLRSEIAHIYLGDIASSQQECIDEWKQRLIELIDRDGIEQVCKNLQRQGIKTAKLVNVRNWIREYFILPEDKFILEALGFEEYDRKRIISAATNITKARIKAGKYIYSKIREQIKKLDFEQLIEEGYQSFEIEEFPGASFNIERIVTIGKMKYQVSTTKTGQIFKLREIRGE